MTVDDVRRLYNETLQGLPGKTFPRWGKFDRDCVGVLLAEIDRLKERNLMLADCLDKAQKQLSALAEAKGVGRG